MRAANPDFGVGDIAKELGRQWGEASDETRDGDGVLSTYAENIPIFNIFSTPKLIDSTMAGCPHGRAKYERLAEKDRARYDVAKREYAIQKKDAQTGLMSTLAANAQAQAAAVQMAAAQLAAAQMAAAAGAASSAAAGRAAAAAAAVNDDEEELLEEEDELVDEDEEAVFDEESD